MLLDPLPVAGPGGRGLLPLIWCYGDAFRPISGRRARGYPMGDKSPKDKDKNKKQGDAKKDQKAAAARDKAKPAAPDAKKK